MNRFVTLLAVMTWHHLLVPELSHEVSANGKWSLYFSLPTKIIFVLS